MSKKKIRSDFDRLECSETEKMFAGINSGTWSFNKSVEISSAVEEWFYPVDLNLEKMKLMMQTHL